MEEASIYHSVFIDTSFNTHIAMMVGEADTVVQFKEKIQHEHAACFPHIGDINIDSLQVKRRGSMYHLSQSMYVRSVFDGVKSTWGLYVYGSTRSDGEHGRSPNNHRKRKSSDCERSHSLKKLALENQLKDNAETFPASKSHVNLQLKKSNQLTIEKSSTAEVSKAENGACRRRVLLSADIFKDDSDESSEDDEAALDWGTALDSLSSSDTEMEDSEGFITPRTVGDRKAAELNKYTKDDVRKAFLLAKSKRKAQMALDAESLLDVVALDSDSEAD